jgi:hypothetical protein
MTREKFREVIIKHLLYEGVPVKKSQPSKKSICQSLLVQMWEREPPNQRREKGVFTAIGKVWRRMFLFTVLIVKDSRDYAFTHASD